MVVALPAELEQGIAAALRGVPASQWTSAARRLSERYRAGVGADRHGARGAIDALGYAAIILPATYAQLHGAMAATAARVPGWEPRTMLDVGSGPGTALWAAVERWPGLQDLTAWEREPALAALGRQLAAAAPHAVLRQAAWRSVTLGRRPPRDVPTYDLVVIGHVLNELDEALRREVVAFAWQHCGGVLLLVEPGTSAAFLVVRAARDQLLTAGAHTLAPCVHDRPCPLVGDWCHFPQRLQRPSFQRRAREAPAGWEESKFSYAAMGRMAPDQPLWGRLIHQPHLRPGYAELTVSSQEGIVSPRVHRRLRAAYARARSYRWGDALAAPPDEESGSGL